MMYLNFWSKQSEGVLRSNQTYQLLSKPKFVSSKNGTFMSWHLRQICGASLCVSHRFSELNDYTMLSHLHSQKQGRCVRHQKVYQMCGLNSMYYLFYLTWSNRRAEDKLPPNQDNPQQFRNQSRQRRYIAEMAVLWTVLVGTYDPSGHCNNLHITKRSWWCIRAIYTYIYMLHLWSRAQNF